MQKRTILPPRIQVNQVLKRTLMTVMKRLRGWLRVASMKILVKQVFDLVTCIVFYYVCFSKRICISLLASYYKRGKGR